MTKTRKPAILLELDNSKSKRSKKDIEARKSCEVVLGTNIIPLPAIVKADPIALKRWNELSALYDGFDFLTSADADTVEQYCLCYSDWQLFRKAKQDLMKLHKKKKIPSYETVEALSKLNIDNMINKKSDLVQKLASKLFLDPVSRLKSIPLPKKEEGEPSKLEKMFGSL